MIVQTGVKFNSEYGLEIPPDLRLYDVPDIHTVEKLVNDNEREHIRQIVQQVTGCKFSNAHLDAMQQIAVRLLATIKGGQGFKFISSTQQLPDHNRYVIIKTEPLYDGDMNIYHINYRECCNCLRASRGECGDLKWSIRFNLDEPFEWSYLNLEEME